VNVNNVRRMDEARNRLSIYKKLLHTNHTI
jgi:hypothetical protein